MLDREFDAHGAVSSDLQCAVRGVLYSHLLGEDTVERCVRASNCASDWPKSNLSTVQ